MRLDEFPRPLEDNGIGIHLGLDLRPAMLDAFVPRLRELRVKWCLVAHDDEQQLQRAAAALARGGMTPLSHWLCQVDRNILDWTRFVHALHALDLPAYIQIFNEPSDPREWRDNLPKPRAFVARWCDHAAHVADAGGLPGLQVLDAEELRAVLVELKARGATNVIQRMWFCPHPYGANHPPDYPYDQRNQYDHPGATLMTDDVTVLGFLEFAPVFKQELGFVPPFIAGEGGWQYRNAEDGRYPRIDDALHARFHAELFNWFHTGYLSNGDPLPDYLFAFCPWILYGAEADAWYSSTTGTRQQTIDAIKALPKFVRPFTPVRPPGIPLPPGAKVIRHYVLFGKETPTAQLRLARQYLTRFQLTFGVSVDQAARAQTVTIVGDRRTVGADDEARLKRAGCRVERLLGDAYALQIILEDRLAREAEYG